MVVDASEAFASANAHARGARLWVFCRVYFHFAAAMRPHESLRLCNRQPKVVSDNRGKPHTPESLAGVLLDQILPRFHQGASCGPPPGCRPHHALCPVARSAQCDAAEQEPRASTPARFDALLRRRRTQSPYASPSDTAALAERPPSRPSRPPPPQTLMTDAAQRTTSRLATR